MGESVAVYVTESRRLVNSCNYGAALHDMLRDRLVAGINDDHIQRRLLAEGLLSFEKALEMALGIEAMAENVRAIRSVSIVSDEGRYNSESTVHEEGVGREHPLLPV